MKMKMNDIMKQAQKMQSQMMQIQEKLAEETVEASEFSVWETIGPAAAVTGYLLNGARLPDPEWVARVPAADFRTLPGYHPLP